MFICERCGETCEFPEIKIVSHATRENPEEKEMCRCSCGGKLVEATQCDICGSWFDGRDMDGVCECCLDEHATVENALKIGKFDKAKVYVNEFIAFALSEEMINKILTKWVEENFVDGSKIVREYCENDIGFFSSFIKDKLGE